MSVYITGDTHGRFYRLEYFCEQTKLSDKDWIIILGDVGLNYYLGKKDVIAKTGLAQIIPAKLFCIHGNHECRPSEELGYHIIDYSDECVSGKFWYDERYPNQFFAIDGEIYKITSGDKTHTVLVCGGAYSVDKHYRLEQGYAWWPDEQPDEATKKKVMEVAKNNHIDIVLTHTCPKRFVPTDLFLSGIDQSTVDNSTEEFLDELYDGFVEKPAWFFGHFHDDRITKDYTMLCTRIVEL